MNDDKTLVFKRFCGTCKQPTDLLAAFEKLKAELAESEAKYNFMVDSAQQNARERDALLKENENLKAELKLTQNRLWDATVFLDTTKEKLKATEIERDTIKAKLAALDRDHADDWKRIQDAERKLAEVEAELDNKRGAMMLEIKRLHELADREREAAKVMREALEQIQSLAANEHEQGDSKALDDVLDLTCETFKALAKADEIRGGE